jgi:hypothetical protein
MTTFLSLFEVKAPLQKNVTPFYMHGQDKRKWEVGRVLKFTGYVEEPGEFSPGDIVRPVERNKCGMGIDVRRDSDGLTDMVWPEEVVFV